MTGNRKTSVKIHACNRYIPRKSGGGNVKSTPVEHSSDKAATNVQSYYGGDLENLVLPQHFHSKL